MSYTRVSIKTKTEAVEAISNLLMEEGVVGVEIDDPKDIIRTNTSPTSWDYVDESLINKDLETVTVRAYFPEDDDIKTKIDHIRARIDEMRAYLDTGSGEITMDTIKEEDWAHQWKKYYKVTPIGKNIIIKPSWEEYKDEDSDKIVIDLDPGMAFGTGTHETTSMCMELLEKHVSQEDIVLDIGTGSGVLAITAAKLGANKVIGVDLDKTAVRVARENIGHNKVADMVDIRQGDLLDVVNEKANIIVANIIADVIIPLSKEVASVMLEDAIFISSGIIEDRIDDVKDALNENFEILEIVRDGEWAAIVAKKKGD